MKSRRGLVIAFCVHVITYPWLNSLRPRQNGRLFADDTFKRIFLNENIRILTKNSLKFVPKGLINNIPALVLIMAWRRPGDKPLSEPMMVRLPTHICVTRPQWVKLANLSVSKQGPILWIHIHRYYISLKVLLCACITGLILGLCPANERRCYFETMSHWLDASLESALVFSATNLALAGFPLTNTLCENMPFRY